MPDLRKWMLSMLTISLIVVLGCAAEQRTATTAATSADSREYSKQLQQGQHYEWPSVRNEVHFHYHEGTKLAGLGSESPTSQTAPIIESATAELDKGALALARAAYAVSANPIRQENHFTIGSSTGGGAMGTGGTGAISQIPTQTVTADLKQEPKAAIPITIQVPVGAMPVANGATANAALEGTANTTASQPYDASGYTMTLPTGSPVSVVGAASKLQAAKGLNPSQLQTGWGLLGSFIAEFKANGLSAAALNYGQQLIQFVASNCPNK